MVAGLHDRRSAVLAALSALASGLDAELRRLGYKDSTLTGKRPNVPGDAGSGSRRRGRCSRPSWRPKSRVAGLVSGCWRRTAELARQTLSLHAREEPARTAVLCAALDPRPRPDQAQQANTAHNPALFIRLWRVRDGL